MTGCAEQGVKCFQQSKGHLFRDIMQSLDLCLVTLWNTSRAPSKLRDLGSRFFTIYRFVTNSSELMCLTQIYLITLGSLYFNLQCLLSQVRHVEWKNYFFSLIKHLLVHFLQCSEVLMLQRKGIISPHAVKKRNK